MDIRPNSAAQLAPRSFTPRQHLPVAGNPRAEQHRPENSPGIIPVGDSNEVDIMKNAEHAKRDSVDYQIIVKVLTNSSDESGESKESAHPESTSNQPELPEQAHASPPSPPSPQSTEASINAAEVRVQLEAITRDREVAQEPVRRSDPIAFDLDNNGINTNTDQRVLFDLDADGQLDTINSLSGKDAFLALDRNENGKIDNGSELFGDQHGASNGFDELSKFDDNQDGVINNLDTVFSRLRLFRPGSDDTISVAEAGIRSISLKYLNTDIALNTYDRISQISSYERNDGSTGATADLLLGLRA